MKLCQTCGQSVAEEITTCPSCGGEIGDGRKRIDDCEIEEVLHEGHASILCRARRAGEDRPVMIRIFTPQSAVNERVAARLGRELEALKKLPSQWFVGHYEIKRSSDGLWYRVSEWVDAENWGELVAAGAFEDYRTAFDLFSKMASAVELLHAAGHFIPHLILNDIMVIRKGDGEAHVKIDYKLSRFLDPKLDRPPPMLKRLLSCHPDIINKRPLDFRSDIWSLGKIFVELLTGDYETCNFGEKVDELLLPHEVKVLFKTMLAEDPDLRPPSMREVAAVLTGITEQEIQEAERQQAQMVSASVEVIRGLRRGHKALAISVGVLMILVALVWLHSVVRERERVDPLEQYAERYARSVAFVLVDYWVKDGTATAYGNRSEGTAFLADRDGYLLTSRHVVCPWLEDGALHGVVAQLRQSGRPPAFGYRTYLWFEGARAFNRSAGLMESPDLADFYFLDTAYRTDGIPRLTIAGVPKPPTAIRQLVHSPLRDDFALLKIDRVPGGIEPLPLDPKMVAETIPRLSGVILLGFPLGSRTQATRVNVSVTRGHVRRSFGDLIQVDASLYGGNSGGPMVDVHGRVIGIASGVAVERIQGLIPMVTPVWHMAMVLPVAKAAAFLREVKAGGVKWNGVLDLAAQIKLKRILETARQGRWAEAVEVADMEMADSLDPSLVMAAAMMRFSIEDYEGARRLFGQSLSMDGENVLAKFMLVLADWLAGRGAQSAYRQELMAADWRSDAEFFGHLTRLLEGEVGETSVPKGWETRGERSWLNYAAGLARARRGQMAEAEASLREAVRAAERDAWEFLLVRASLDKVQRRRLEKARGEVRWGGLQAEMEGFNQAIEKAQAEEEVTRARLAELHSSLEKEGLAPAEKRRLMEEIRRLAPEDGKTLAALAFHSAALEAWEASLEQTRDFLRRESRESLSRLSLGLLEAGILHAMGRHGDARAMLEAYVHRTRDPWHRAIGDCLLGRRTEESLRKDAAASPEKLVTLHMSLGLWAEGSGDRKKAIDHYREAMASFLDTWVQFAFARERIRLLRQRSE